MVKTCYENPEFKQKFFSPISELTFDTSETCRSFFFPPKYNPAQHLADKEFQVSDTSIYNKKSYLDMEVYIKLNTGVSIPLVKVDFIFDKDGKNILSEHDETNYNLLYLSDILYSSISAIFLLIDMSQTLNQEQKNKLKKEILVVFLDSSCNGGASFKISGKTLAGGKTKNKKAKSKKRKNKKTKKRKTRKQKY